jgi:hypothetical protein
MHESHRTVGHVHAVFLWRRFSLWRFLFCTVALFFPMALSFAYITIPAVIKQKGKTTPTQSNDAI